MLLLATAQKRALAHNEEELMNTIEPVASQVLQHEIYFASQYNIQNLCEIVAQKDFAIVPSAHTALESFS